MKFPTITLPKNNLPLTPAKRQYIPQWGEVAPVQPIPAKGEGEPLRMMLKPYWSAGKSAPEPAVVRTYGGQLVQASRPRVPALGKAGVPVVPTSARPLWPTQEVPIGPEPMEEPRPITGESLVPGRPATAEPYVAECPPGMVRTAEGRCEYPPPPVRMPKPYEPSGLRGPSFLGGKFRGATLGQEEEIADLLGEINKLIGKLPSAKAAPLQTKLAACQALVLVGGFFGLLQAVVCLRELYVEAKAAVDKLDEEPTPVPTPTPVVKSEIPWGIVIGGLAGAGILGYLAFKKG